MYGSIARTEVSHNEIKGSLVLSTVVCHVHVLLFPECLLVELFIH